MEMFYPIKPLQPDRGGCHLSSLPAAGQAPPSEEKAEAPEAATQAPNGRMRGLRKIGIGSLKWLASCGPLFKDQAKEGPPF